MCVYRLLWPRTVTSPVLKSLSTPVCSYLHHSISRHSSAALAPGFWFDWTITYPATHVGMKQVPKLGGWRINDIQISLSWYRRRGVVTNVLIYPHLFHKRTYSADFAAFLQQIKPQSCLLELVYLYELLIQERNLWNKFMKLGWLASNQDVCPSSEAESKKYVCVCMMESCLCSTVLVLMFLLTHSP